MQTTVDTLSPEFARLGLAKIFARDPKCLWSNGSVLVSLSYLRMITLSTASLGLDRLVGSIPFVYAVQYSQNKISYRLRGTDVEGQGVWLDRSAITDLTLNPSGRTRTILAFFR